MPNVTPEQKRISDLELALEIALYWLLLAQDGGIKNVATSRAVEVLLANHGLTPKEPKARALLKKAPQVYHFELEAAVKRATK